MENKNFGNVGKLISNKTNKKLVLVLGNDPNYSLATKGNRDQFEQQFHQHFIESFLKVGRPEWKFLSGIWW